MVDKTVSTKVPEAQHQQLLAAASAAGKAPAAFVRDVLTAHLDGVPLVHEAAQDPPPGDLAAQVVQLQTQVAQLQARSPATAAGEMPDLHTLIAHCEGGGCKAHADQWEQVKAELVQQAYDQMPTELVHEKGVALGLIPTKIVVQPAGATND